MKKTKVLSLATAAAIVATSFMTFAAWDSLESTGSADLTVRNPITVTAGDFSQFATNTALESVPVYESTVKFNVNEVPANAEITLSTTIASKTEGDTSVNVSQFTVKYKKDGKEVTNGIDADVTVGDNVYTVEVTPKEEHKNTVAGKALDVSVSAVLSAGN